MHIRQRAGVNRQSAQRRRKQMAPQSMVDAMAAYTLSRIPVSKLGQQASNSIANGQYHGANARKQTQRGDVDTGVANALTTP